MNFTELSLIWRLARRELRGGLKGFRILLACLFIGVTTIAAIGSLSSALTAGLVRDGRILLGGDLDLRLTHRPATPEQLDWLKARYVVAESIQMRVMLRPQSKTDQRRGQLLAEAKAVDGLYPLFGALELRPAQTLRDALAPRDGRHGIAVDQGVLERLDLALGEDIAIGEARYRIAAIIDKEPDRLTRGLSFGPPVLLLTAGLEASGLLQPGSLIRYHYRLALPADTDLAAARAAIEARFPDAGWRITDATKAAPRISRFIERVTLYLNLVGLASLLIGGLGVANAVRAFLLRKTATIATLKCLGAPSRLIFRSYLLQVMLLALLGVAAALVAGAVLPILFGSLLGDFLGFDVALGPYPWALAKAGIFGLLTTLTFALWPLARASATAPTALFRHRLAALSTRRPGGLHLPLLVLSATLLILFAWTTSSDPLVSGIFIALSLASLGVFYLAARLVAAWAARRHPRQPLLRLALANLHRPDSGVGAVVLSLGLGLTLLSAIALVEANLERQVGEVIPADAPSFYFIDIQPDQTADFDALVSGQPGARGLERVPMLRGRILALQGRPVADWQIPEHVRWVFRGDRGITWAGEMPRQTELTAGTWWPKDYSGPPLVSLDDELGQTLGLAPGDSLTLSVLGREFEVEIASLRRIDWSDLRINFILMLSPGLLEAAPQSHIATVKVPKTGEAALEAAVVRQFPNVSAVRVRDALAQMTEIMGHISLAVRLVAGVALAAGVLVLIGALAADQDRRSYDAVILKVLGATRRRLLAGYLVEQGLLSLISAGMAAVLGSFAAYLVLTGVLHSEFVFMPLALATTLLLAGGLALVFGFAASHLALSERAAGRLRNR